VRLYRGEAPEFAAGSAHLLDAHFPWPLAGEGPGESGRHAYADVAGLCKAATLAEIEAQGWSLNPGRYVGVGARPADEFDFAERLAELNEELEVLSLEAQVLEGTIAANVAALLSPSAL